VGFGPSNAIAENGLLAAWQKLRTFGICQVVLLRKRVNGFLVCAFRAVS